MVDELSCVTRQDCALTRGDEGEDGGKSSQRLRNAIQLRSSGSQRRAVDLTI